MDPTLLYCICLAAAAVAVGAVVWGAGRAAADRHAARGHYRTALYHAQSADEKLGDAAAGLAQARADLRAAEARAAEHAAELDDAADELRATADGVNDLAVAFEKHTDVMESEAAPDTDPTGVETTAPVAYSTWHDDDDFHYVQASLWPMGGGVDLTTAVNGASQSASYTWQEFDVLASLAARMRDHDPDAPEPVHMSERLPYAEECDEEDCGNCASEEDCRKAWADATAADAPKATPAHVWEDPDADE